MLGRLSTRDAIEKVAAAYKLKLKGKSAAEDLSPEQVKQKIFKVLGKDPESQEKQKRLASVKKQIAGNNQVVDARVKEIASDKAKKLRRNRRIRSAMFGTAAVLGAVGTGVAAKRALEKKPEGPENKTAADIAIQAGARHAATLLSKLDAF